MGRVAGLFVKPAVAGEAGLPKRPLASVRIAPRGLDGDFNRYRQERKAGDPDMAVLLLAQEVLDGLRREGWPVGPGDLGENVLTSGLSYEVLQVGRAVRVGGAEVQVSKRCDPCDNLYALPYVGEAKGPAFLKATLGRRGMYARVLREGVVRVGDPVEAR